MVAALARDQAPDVGQGWMDGWVAGRGSGSVCPGLAGLCVLSVQMPVCCFRIGWEDGWEGRSMFPHADTMAVHLPRLNG